MGAPRAFHSLTFCFLRIRFYQNVRPGGTRPPEADAEGTNRRLTIEEVRFRKELTARRAQLTSKICGWTFGNLRFDWIEPNDLFEYLHEQM